MRALEHSIIGVSKSIMCLSLPTTSIHEPNQSIHNCDILESNHIKCGSILPQTERSLFPLKEIFWQNSEQTHMTVSIRKLLEVVTLLLLDYTGSKLEVI